MKQVLEYFGGTLIAVIVAGCVLGIFSGLSVHYGKLIDETLPVSVVGIGENQAFVHCLKNPKWSISVKKNCEIGVEESYDIDDLLEMMDPEGTECDIRFITIQSETVAEAQGILTDEGKSFCCSHPGVYLAVVEGYSASYGYYEMQIRFLVNQEVSI